MTVKIKLQNRPLLWGGGCWEFKAVQFSAPDFGFTAIYQDNRPCGVIHSGGGFISVPFDGGDVGEYELFFVGMGATGKVLKESKYLFNDTLNRGLQTLSTAQAAGLLAKLAGANQKTAALIGQIIEAAQHEVPTI